MPDYDYLQHTSHALPRQIFIWIFTNHDISSDRYRSNDHLNASTDQMVVISRGTLECLPRNIAAAAESWHHGIVLMRSSDQTWRHITSRAGRHIWSPLEIMVIVLMLYQLSARGEGVDSR